MGLNGFNDSIAEVDLLGLDKQTEGLANFITTCITPITISVQGEWGSGKTSFMHLVEKCIQQKGDENVHCFWFNTWQFSQFNMGNALPISMMLSLLNQLEPKKNDAVAKALKGVAAFGKKVIKIATDSTFGSEMSATVGQIMDGEKQESYIDEINTLKENLQNAIYDVADTDEKRVVVFIDDLDRLQPDKAVELLEVLKVFFDCERCVFVLAIDYSVVCTGIKMKYGSEIGSQKGRDFFDKIIQVPFKMPVAQYDTKNYIKNYLGKMDSKYITAEDLSLYEELISSSIGTNPRAMKRLFNAFLLQNMIQSQDDIDRKVLFALLCMQTSDKSEPIYDYIVRNKSVMDYETINKIFAGNFDELPEEIKDALCDYQRKTAFVESKSEAMNIAKEKYSELEKFWKNFCVAVDKKYNDLEISTKAYKAIMSTICRISLQPGEDEKKIEFKVYKASDETKKAVNDFSEKFANNGELISWAKSKGIVWAEHEHAGINVMRVKMAIQEALDKKEISLEI